MLWLRVVDEPGGLESLPKIVAGNLHKDASGKSLFVIGVKEVNESPANAHRKCPICSIRINNPAKALAHSAYHYLETPTQLPPTRCAPSASARPRTARRTS